jgi:hypothetical protein
VPETVRIKHRAFLSYSHAAPEVAAADGRGDDPRRHEAIVGSGADAEVCRGSAMATSRLMLATARQKRDSYRNFAWRLGPKTRVTVYGFKPSETTPRSV